MKKFRFRFRLRLFVADEYQPLRVVPRLLWLAFFCAIAGQVAFSKWVLPPPKAEAETLRRPPSDATFRLSALGDPPVLARVMMLSLQGYDNQRGASVPFRKLNYDIIGEWLDRIVAMDERAEYPHFSASKLYGVVNEESRRRKMISWVRRHFAGRPNDRWEWMAFSTNLAHYTLKDKPLALAMARELRQQTTPGKVPLWPRQVEIWFLEDAGEYQTAAKMLLRQLLDGEVSGEAEDKFTRDRLTEMLAEMTERGDISQAESRRMLGEMNAAKPQI